MDPKEEAQKMWDEVTAERSGQSVAPAAKPDDAAPNPAANQKDGDDSKANAVADAATGAADVTAQPEPTTEEKLAAALARLDKIEGRQRNVEGHIGGLSSQQKSMQQTMDAAKQAAEAVKDAPSQAQVKEAAANPAEWEKLKADFPEWSEATEAFMNSKLSGIKAGASEEFVNKLVQDGLASMRTEVTKEVEAKIVDASLEAVFPGWKDSVKTDAFGVWLNSQADDVKSLAMSTSVGDAARMLSLFNQHSLNNPAQKLLDKRKSVLQNASTAPRGRTSTPSKSVDEMTPDELWNHEAKVRERARASN